MTTTTSLIARRYKVVLIVLVTVKAVLPEDRDDLLEEDEFIAILSIIELTYNKYNLQGRS